VYRKVINQILALIGVCVVLGAVVVLTTGPWQVVLVIIGLLILETSVWGMAYRVLPERRIYNALRSEVDHFIALVRQLNTAAVALKQQNTPETRQKFDEVLAAMRQKVDRIAAVVGKTENELSPE
jgi:hypothetical protein